MNQIVININLKSYYLIAIEIIFIFHLKMNKINELKHWTTVVHLLSDYFLTKKIKKFQRK
jgi:hypothetical protein